MLERHKDLHTLGEYCYVGSGPTLNLRKSPKAELISDTQDDTHSRKYIEAKDIKRYEVRRVRYLEWDTPRCRGTREYLTLPEFYARPKLLCKRSSELAAVLDGGAERFLHDDSLIGCMLWRDLRGVKNLLLDYVVTFRGTLSRKQREELSEAVSLEYLLAVLNSRYARALLAELRGEGHRIYPGHIRDLPIPPATAEMQERIARYVRLVMEGKREGGGMKLLETILDALVCELYGLTLKEVEELCHAGHRKHKEMK